MKQLATQQLPVMEHFYTLQGEGYWTGTPAYFIRLAGCDVGCFWCDVKASWEVEAHQFFTLDEILSWPQETAAKHVVITGGEPAMYDLLALTNGLRRAGFKVHLETSGVYPILGTFDWVCLSPKKFKATLPENYAKADELKVIVYNRHDLTWAAEQAAYCGPGKTRFFLQPEWTKRNDLENILEYIREHPQWRLSLQTHKYINIP